MTDFEKLQSKQVGFASIGDLENSLDNALGKLITISGNFYRSINAPDEPSSLQFRCTLDSYCIETTPYGTYKFTLDIKDPEALDSNNGSETDFPNKITFEIGGLSDSLTNSTHSVITSNGITVNLGSPSGDILDTKTPILPRQNVSTLDEAYEALNEAFRTFNYESGRR